MIPSECVINNIEMIKVHVDWLNEETHSIFRRMKLDFLVNSCPRMYTVFQKSNVVITMIPAYGQDEAVYRQYAISSKEWTVDGAGKMFTWQTINITLLKIDRKVSWRYNGV